MENFNQFYKPNFISTLFTVLAHLICPILFIWSVNSLFGLAIAYSFKTWLAGFVLFLILRFHLKPNIPQYDDDFYSDDEFDEDDEDELTPEERRARMKASIIGFSENKDKKKDDPPDARKD